MKTTKTMAILALLNLTSAQAATITNDTAMKLMTKSGCMTCHSIEKNKIGPSYKEVSNHYNKLSPETLAYLKGEKPFDYLMKKIRTGTKVGVNKNWIKSKEGKNFGMMTPNAVSRISDAELKDLVTFILSLK